MSLNARLSRMEAMHGGRNPPLVIIAVDDDDFDRQFEDALLASRPGLLSVSGSIGPTSFNEAIKLASHEDFVESLS
ncbi:hypothetical protein ABMA32_03615 [Mesorhizobium sp. VNQ89]|uniref:hypothetical protein n=1 Tax=Mesorhizobium quangtriensis TaxID=3157709 RepID=UPI0032B86DE1